MDACYEIPIHLRRMVHYSSEYFGETPSVSVQTGNRNQAQVCFITVEKSNNAANRGGYHILNLILRTEPVNEDWAHNTTQDQNKLLAVVH